MNHSHQTFIKTESFYLLKYLDEITFKEKEYKI